MRKFVCARVDHKLESRFENHQLPRTDILKSNPMFVVLLLANRVQVLVNA